MKSFFKQIGRAAWILGLRLNRRHLMALVAVGLATQLQAQTMTGYKQTLPGKGSKCKISGTSTVHDWSMESPIIIGNFEVDSKVNFDTSKASLEGLTNGKLSAKADVRIPVRTLKSEFARMDEVYKQHMDERKFRNMEYKLKELTLKKGEHAAGKPFEFDSKGDLTIHGVTKAIEIPVQIEPDKDKMLKISGKTTLKMSDYSVSPPNPKIPGIGEIKTGDEITVEFDWVVQPK